MTWSTRGVIVPAPLPFSWSVSHAALPVVLPTGDGLRLYCSTRDADGVSRVAAGWLDVERGAAVFDEEVAITTGPLGAFDDHGATSSCVVDDGTRVLQYYTGWNLGVTVPFYLAVGCAASEDGGRTFTKVSSAPVLGRSSVDPFLAASPSILVESGLWRMWYVSGTDWSVHAGAASHRYHIKYAESDDGIAWRPTGHVCIDYRDAEETSIARPCVVKDGEVYRMWYCSRGDAYRLGYAESRDGLVWERLDDDVGLNPSSTGWDAEMQAYPFVFDQGNSRHLLYNGNGFGLTGIGLAVLEDSASPSSSS